MSVLQPEQEVPVVLGGVPQVLPHQEEVRPEGPHHLASSLAHDDGGGDARLGVGRDGELAELGLLHANVKVAVDAAAAEVLGPVRVGVVDDEEGEAAVAVDARDADGAGRVLGLLHLGAHHLGEARYLRREREKKGNYFSLDLPTCLIAFA